MRGTTTAPEPVLSDSDRVQIAYRLLELRRSQHPDWPAGYCGVWLDAGVLRERVGPTGPPSVLPWRKAVDIVNFYGEPAAPPAPERKGPARESGTVRAHQHERTPAAQ